MSKLTITANQKIVGDVVLQRIRDAYLDGLDGSEAFNAALSTLPALSEQELKRLTYSLMGLVSTNIAAGQSLVFNGGINEEGDWHWGAYPGTGYTAPGYKVLPTGEVVLFGLIRYYTEGGGFPEGPQQTIASSLPPVQGGRTAIFIVESNGGMARVDIYGSGALVWMQNGDPRNYVSLNGIRYFTDL